MMRAAILALVASRMYLMSGFFSTLVNAGLRFRDAERGALPPTHFEQEQRHIELRRDRRSHAGATQICRRKSAVAAASTVRLVGSRTTP
jgi:hypothetical protein